MAYPNTVIIGAPKCGTSSLFFWLTAHPDVCGSKQKETYFLADRVYKHNKTLNYVTDGLEAYQQHFKHYINEKVIIEASAPYIYHNTPLEVLPTLSPKPKIIIILRKPADRLFSHYQFNRYRMRNMDLNFEQYLDVENNGLDWVDYIDQTYYAKWVKKWIDKFGKEDVLVYLMEDMKTDRVSFMKTVANDLGIDPEFYNGFDFFHRNKTVEVKNPKLHRLGLKIEKYTPQWLQEKLIPIYLKLNSSALPKITEEEKKLKLKITEDFKEKNKELAELTGLDLSVWE